eukprot:1154925-Pelagomonas_calceolata.AAC.5
MHGTDSALPWRNHHVTDAAHLTSHLTSFHMMQASSAWDRRRSALEALDMLQPAVPKPRVLVCAPSNAATDELCERILKMSSASASEGRAHKHVHLCLCAFKTVTRSACLQPSGMDVVASIAASM